MTHLVLFPKFQIDVYMLCLRVMAMGWQHLPEQSPGWWPLPVPFLVFGVSHQELAAAAGEQGEGTCVAPTDSA